MSDKTNDSEPVHLVEDAETGDRFLFYGTDRGMRLDIRYEGETLWMTQAQIGQLFGRDQSVISRHIKNVLDDGELAEGGNMQKVHIATSTRPGRLIKFVYCEIGRLLNYLNQANVLRAT